MAFYAQQPERRNFLLDSVLNAQNKGFAAHQEREQTKMQQESARDQLFQQQRIGQENARFKQGLEQEGEAQQYALGQQRSEAKQAKNKKEVDALLANPLLREYQASPSQYAALIHSQLSDPDIAQSFINSYDKTFGKGGAVAQSAYDEIMEKEVAKDVAHYRREGLEASQLNGQLDKLLELSKEFDQTSSLNRFSKGFAAAQKYDASSLAALEPAIQILVKRGTVSKEKMELFKEKMLPRSTMTQEERDAKVLAAKDYLEPMIKLSEKIEKEYERTNGKPDPKILRKLISGINKLVDKEIVGEPEKAENEEKVKSGSMPLTSEVIEEYKKKAKGDKKKTLQLLEKAGYDVS